jgi:hypothetical protein
MRGTSPRPTAEARVDSASGSKFLHPCVLSAFGRDAVRLAFRVLELVRLIGGATVDIGVRP